MNLNLKIKKKINGSNPAHRVCSVIAKAQTKRKNDFAFEFH